MKGEIKWQDMFLRALILISGVIAGVLFIMKGEADALPALALGTAVGVCVVGFSEQQEG